MDVLALIAEQRIAEAQHKGEFDNLAGQGKPLQMEDDHMIPSHLRMAYTILKNAHILPPELECRREISTIVEMLQQCEDEQTRYRQMQKLQLLIQKLDSRRSRPVHIADHYYRQVLERIHATPKNNKNGGQAA
jgi:hypothetical protein